MYIQATLEYASAQWNATRIVQELSEISYKERRKVPSLPILEDKGEMITTYRGHNDVNVDQFFEIRGSPKQEDITGS